ncbi:hypothetical protein JZ751_028088 [Albula glossodonta]|uniref:Uncharacterized protein n=1 Tax=Albula glossodonta TaxID=121402 RepID=A0A8T2PC99_9TELE|nr:hypothetical protein JZ751_028088 [Albula glossodonta]
MRLWGQEDLLGGIWGCGGEGEEGVLIGKDAYSFSECGPASLLCLIEWGPWALGWLQ